MLQHASELANQRNDGGRAHRLAATQCRSHFFLLLCAGVGVLVSIMYAVTNSCKIDDLIREYCQYWKKVVMCCEVNHCQYLSSTVCFIRVFQHGFLLVTLRLVDCLSHCGLHIGITCEGNRRIVVVSEINNNISVKLTANMPSRHQRGFIDWRYRECGVQLYLFVLA